MKNQDRGALIEFLEASVYDFPTALQKWMLCMDNSGQEIEQAVLKACQAWTQLANQSVERMYQAQGFVSLMTSSIRHFVRWNQVARDFMDSLMEAQRAPKLALNGDAAELRESVSKLRREMRELTARVNLLDRGSELRNGAQQ